MGMIGQDAQAAVEVGIASNADPASGALVDLYEKTKNAGAQDVVVAREQAPARPATA